jgi:hypothetical protein
MDGTGVMFWLQDMKRDDFLTFAELNNEIFVPFQPSIVVFDACGMGSVSTLFGIDPHVRYVVASPGLQPYCSFLDFSRFSTPNASQQNAGQFEWPTIGYVLQNAWTRQGVCSSTM